MKSKILMIFTVAILQSCIWQSSFAMKIADDTIGEPINWSKLASHHQLHEPVVIVALDARPDGSQECILADKFGMYQHVAKRAGQKYVYAPIYKGDLLDPLAFDVARARQEALLGRVNNQLQAGQVSINVQFDPVAKVYRMTNKTNIN